MKHQQIDPRQREKVRAEFAPSWELVENSQLQKTFRAQDHRQAIEFISACMLPSERLDHFPDVAFFYNEILMRITHHDSGGLVDSSYILARAIDQAAEKMGISGQV